MPTAEDRSQAVVILAPSGGDGRLAKQMLERAGLQAVVCTDMANVTRCIESGVGVALIAEEALGRTARDAFASTLERQPPWSDLPVVVLLAQGELSDAIPAGVVQLAGRGNVTLLERPVRVATLVTTLRSALRARARQYDVRDSIAQRLAAAEGLRESEARLRAAVLAAPYPLMLHAQDGAIPQLSHAWAELSGYSPEELTTTDEWRIRADGDDASGTDSLIRDDMESGDPTLGMPRALGERQVRTRGGALRTWDFQSVSLGRLPDGRKLRLVAATDVTEFRRLLASERAARERASRSRGGGAGQPRQDGLPRRDEP